MRNGDRLILDEHVMDLILWRHAEAEEGFPDTLRKLTPKGLNQANRMAAWLKQKIPENTRIIVSPAIRTQQTAQALQLNFITDSTIGPGAGADAILAAAHWPDASSAVLIVGHQPTIGEVASYLISSIPAGLRVKKGSVWWIRSQLRDKTIESELHAVMYPEDV